jgi:FKBP-type peptidyl-prolyl cis-trans isomerase 2
MVVRRIGDGTITLDGNHPLAGKTLTFLVTVTEIRPLPGAPAPLPVA